MLLHHGWYLSSASSFFQCRNHGWHVLMHCYRLEHLHLPEKSSDIFPGSGYKYKLFEKSGEKIKLPSSKELYNLVTESDEWKVANCDTYAKNAAYKLAMQNFYTYFKSSKSYRKNPSKFQGKPKIPNYVKDRYIPVILDKTRLGKKKVTKNQFRIPKSNVIINFSKRFEKKDIRNVSFNQCCGKIKVIISYEKKEEEPIINNSFIGIDIGIDNLASITSNDKNFSYIVKGTPLKSMNQYYNKRRAQIQSELEKCNKKKFSIKK